MSRSVLAQRIFSFLGASALLLLLLVAAPIAAQKKAKGKKHEAAADLQAVIWRDPGPAASLDLIYGAGGKAHAPDPVGEYKFLEEDRKGFSPKFDVEDEHGVRWRVKLGVEPQSETAATRLLWAAGYFTDEDYFLPELKVSGLPKLHRGREFVSDDGTVRRARLERHTKELKHRGNWSWFDNPFIGNQEFDGLRVMMALLNSFDLKPDNNSISEADGQLRYLVSDVGECLGKTGNELTRSESNYEDYARAKFIEKIAPDTVDFVMHTRPFFMIAPDIPYYRRLLQMSNVAKHIPLEHVRWIGRRLAQLSPDQIRDCFRAAGYSPDEVEGYAKAVQKRIAELNAL